MPVTTTDRPIDTLREETIDRLIVSYAHNELSLEAFERRLDQALDARMHQDLTALTADLSSPVDRSYTEKKQEALGLPARARRESTQTDDVDYMVHVFSGSNRGGRWAVAEEIRMFNVFGGTELDFTDAQFTAPRSRIVMYNVFGGATFYVPEHVNVVSNALCVFGGIDNRAATDNPADAPTLVLEGLCLFGGAAIKVRGSLKKRLRKFADSIRSSFGPAH